MILTILLNSTKTRYRRFFGRKGFFDDAFGGFNEMRLEREREFEDIEKKTRQKPLNIITIAVTYFRLCITLSLEGFIGC